MSLPEYLELIEREILIEAYDTVGSTWKAAEKLGVSQSYIMRRLKKYGLKVDGERRLVEARLMGPTSSRKQK